MSGDFNISQQGMSLESLKAYFKSSNAELNADEESKINTIFAECDTQNAKGEEGADGVLTGTERSTFLSKIRAELPKLLYKLVNYISMLNAKEVENVTGNSTVPSYRTQSNTQAQELSEATKPTIKKQKLGNFTRIFIIPQEKSDSELKQLIKNCDINDNAQVAETLTILHNSFKVTDENLNKWIKKLFGKNLTSIEQPNRDSNIEYHLADGRIIKRSGDNQSYGYIEIINPDSTVDKFKPYHY